MSLTLAPALSSSLGLARKLSRAMVGLFALALLLNLSMALTAPLFAIFQKTPGGAGLGYGLGEGIIVRFGSLTPAQATGATIGMELFAAPRILAMYNILRMFLCFSKGEIFAARPIAHLRAAGWWLTATFFASIAAVWLLHSSGSLNPAGGVTLRFPAAVMGLAIFYRSALFTGIPLLIAAYVMEEARRIAADHAEIV